MLNNEVLEDHAMVIIANAGAARSSAFEALTLAKARDFGAAASKLEESECFAHAAHDAHTELLQLHAKGEVGAVDLLVSHAQDHLMCAVLAKEMIAELIDLYAGMDELRKVTR